MFYPPGTIEFTDYTYTSISGYSYSPCFCSGKWFLVYQTNVMPFEKIALLCNIPEGESTFLKLKYGG